MGVHLRHQPGVKGHLVDAVHEKVVGSLSRWDGLIRTSTISRLVFLAELEAHPAASELRLHLS